MYVCTYRRETHSLIDVEFAFGISFPTPSTFWSTAGSPPFIPDIGTPTDTNEPYTKVWFFVVFSL